MKIGCIIITIAIMLYGCTSLLEEKEYEYYQDGSVKSMVTYNTSEKSGWPIFDEKEVSRDIRVDYYPNKIIKSRSVYALDTDLICSEFYFKNGRLFKKYCKQDDKFDGPYYQYFNDGTLEEERNFNLDKADGGAIYYNKKGKVKAINKNKLDEKYYKLINKYDSTGDLSASYESYYPIIEMPDTIGRLDSLIITFDFLEDSIALDCDSIEISYGIALSADITTDRLGPSQRFIDTNEHQSFVFLGFKDSGDHTLYGYVRCYTDGNILESHEDFYKSFHIKSDSVYTESVQLK